MARVSKRTRRRRLLQGKRFYQRCLFMLHNCSPLVKTMLFMRVFELGIKAKRYLRSPRNVGRKRSREWCDKDMLEMGEAEFIANFRLSRPAFHKLCQEIGPRIERRKLLQRTPFQWKEEQL